MRLLKDICSRRVEIFQGGSRDILPVWIEYGWDGCYNVHSI